MGKSMQACAYAIRSRALCRISGDRPRDGLVFSDDGHATQCAKVVWYTAKYPSPDGFYIIVR